MEGPNSENRNFGELIIERVTASSTDKTSCGRKFDSKMMFGLSRNQIGLAETLPGGSVLKDCVTYEEHISAFIFYCSSFMKCWIKNS